MALPSSGTISIEDIVAEFGGSAPNSLSEYYGVAAGVPASGTISLDDFYGASNSVPLKLIVESAEGGKTLNTEGGRADWYAGGSGCRSAWNGKIPPGTVLRCAAGRPGKNAESMAGGGGGAGSGVWVGSTANVLCVAGGGGGGGGDNNRFGTKAGRGRANTSGSDTTMTPDHSQIYQEARTAVGGNNGSGGRGGKNTNKTATGETGASWGTGNGGYGGDPSNTDWMSVGGSNGSGYMSGGTGHQYSGDWGGSGGGGGYGGGGGGGHAPHDSGAAAGGGSIAKSASAVGAVYESGTGTSNGSFWNGQVSVYVNGVLVKTQAAGGTSNYTV